MRDFSIDLYSEKIHSSKTKEYFEEVIRSYYNDSYRSAVVMLYSIAIADLVYKIEELKDLYNDSSAIEILDEITDLQKKNPRSPDWESKLIELVKQKTNLLEPSDYLNLITLQQHRHLCAHPVLTQNFELYRPNKETTRSHIRNTLEGILTKPAFLSRKIFDDLLQELVAVKTLIHNQPQLEKHLNTKYFDKLSPSAIQKIFKSLWRITFKTDDKHCNENREINLEALSILLKKNYELLNKSISSEKDYYSDINTNYLYQLISLLNRYPEIYNQLNDSIKILANNIIEKDADLVSFSIFLTGDIDKHVDKILDMNLGWGSSYNKTHIYTESILAVFERALSEGKRDLAYSFLIDMFGKSDQYAIADDRFDNIIYPNLKNFNKKEVKKIVDEVNNNSQIYGRRKATDNNYLIRQRVNELYTKFDFVKYPNFK
ncbi:hypothetical protein CLV24_12169 [Pontibacter ummariensis]|uniref:Uncharacterized protein n=1 Tax=Pontibacter ummariensis TaxID=1610492 RepID=A0A239JE45_9BACT|nr:hypothetical protein [Pontibacter ummariensis]PRY08382.1 hypothetical protein CLV24_12169 [Pontibacter ummariensis]SNT04090.1 hypothetical protein SAMN06296052_12169 [Pontibacter ummariensis]